MNLTRFTNRMADWDGASMSFGEQLRKLREKLELSQAALAKRAGLSIRSIQNWEQGHRGPSAPAIHALAAALQVSADGLLKEVARDAATGRKQPKRPRGRPRKSE